MLATQSENSDQHHNPYNNPYNHHQDYSFAINNVSDGRNSRHSKTTEGSFPSMVYRMRSRPYFFSSSIGSGHESNKYNNDPTPDKPTNNNERNTGKDKINNRHQALKLIWDYYQKFKQFSSAVDEDWLRHFAQFNTLEDKYESDSETRLTHLICSLKLSSQAYQKYQ